MYLSYISVKYIIINKSKKTSVYKHSNKISNRVLVL